jgi:hypothetical protein
MENISKIPITSVQLAGSNLLACDLSPFRHTEVARMGESKKAPLPFFIINQIIWHSSPGCKELNETAGSQITHIFFDEPDRLPGFSTLRW